MAKPELHLFVCLNKREGEDPRGDCMSRGAEAVHAQFKALVKEKKLNGRIRVNKAGCLDQCQHGTVAVVYPEGVWYRGLTVEDVPRIVEKHFVEGEVVEELRF